MYKVLIQVEKKRKVAEAELQIALEGREENDERTQILLRSILLNKILGQRSRSIFRGWAKYE